MFGFFSNKKNKRSYQAITESGLSAFFSEEGTDKESTVQKKNDLQSLIQDIIIVKDDFPRLDWHTLFQGLDKLATSTQEQFDTPEFYNGLQLEWLLKIQRQLGNGSQVNQSENFVLLSTSNQKELSLIFPFFESVYHRILRILNGVVHPRNGEKLAVILFEDIDLYYQYISHYYPDNGEYGMSSGVFLDGGLGHFVLANTEMSELESVVSHELTHALLNHLSIPLWVNEGLAVNTETAITGFSPYLLNVQKHEKHIGYWNEKTIQDFWSGASFSKPGISSELSYQLAQLLIRSMSEDFAHFAHFANLASFEDSGEAAAIEFYGGSLGSLIEGLYGEGDWRPRPELWKQNIEASADT